jgi:hypothetical protein
MATQPGAQPQVIAGVPIINGSVMKMTYGGQLLPYIADHVYCNYGKNFFTAFLELWMDKRYDSSTEIYHVEESQQIYTIKIAADATASAAGAPVTLQVDTTGLPPGTMSVQPGYFVGIPPLGKMGRIASTDPVAGTIVVEPNDKLYKITVKAGDDLIIAPAAVVAACSCDCLDNSMKLPGLMYKSQMMTICKSLKICGEDLAQWLSDRWLFPLKSIEDPCEDVDVWWHAELDQMWYEFMYAKQIFAMLGEDITNDSANFAGLKSTTGILHMLRARATQEPVPASVGITIDYFRRISKRFKTMRNYCDEYGVWAGYEFRSQIDAIYDGMVNMTCDVCAWNFMNGDKERGLRLGFDALKIDGIAYYFHDENSLNDPGLLGANGFNGPETLFMIPLCKIPCGNKMATTFIIRYLAGNGINRELMENDYGVLRPGSESSNCDWHTWTLKSQFGIDAYCVQNMILTESV